MSKSHQKLYGNNLLEYSARTIAEFVLAYSVKKDKAVHMDACIGWFAVLRMDLDFVLHRNIIQYPARRDEHGKLQGDERISSEKVALIALIGDTDRQIGKFREWMEKSTCTPAEADVTD